MVFRDLNINTRGIKTSAKQKEESHEIKEDDRKKIGKEKRTNVENKQQIISTNKKFNS